MNHIDSLKLKPSKYMPSLYNHQFGRLSIWPTWGWSCSFLFSLLISVIYEERNKTNQNVWPSFIRLPRHFSLAIRLLNSCAIEIDHVLASSTLFTFKCWLSCSILFSSLLVLLLPSIEIVILIDVLCLISSIWHLSFV